MLRDITIGQHFPGTSPIHRMDPRLKLVLTLAYIIALFLVQHLAGIAAAFLLVLALYAAAAIPLRLLGRSLRPLIPILLFTGLLNLFFTGGTPLVQVWFITITREGLYNAAMVALRILCLIAGSSLLTYTTSPIVLTDAIERLLRPLAALRLPVHELAMIMTIALRFIPTLIEETEKIMNAQKARGAELDTGSIFQRVRALVPVLIPLFVSAFRRADELAMAMECRCYHGGDGRTRLRQLHLVWRDWAMAAVFCLVAAALLTLDRLL